MPLICIDLPQGVANADKRQRLIQEITEAVVAVEGEAVRPATRVAIYELGQGERAIGRTLMKAASLHALRARVANQGS